MNGPSNPWEGKFPATRQGTAIPEPNMAQATQAPAQAPAPFPQSGFAKQGAMMSRPVLPKLWDER